MAPGLQAPIGAGAKPALPVPAVEPLLLDTSKPDEARRLNAAIPFSTADNPAARPFHYAGDQTSLARATDCLAAALIYEAGDDPVGQRAVGQVVLNRLRHPAYPKTVCGVVFQGQERATGCQFTFTCDGAMTRTPSTAAWERARGLASKMLAGDVYAPVGYSTHYHTDWVVPYWSSSLEKVAAVDTHLFFRWTGWWGTPGAFLRSLTITAEPAIIKLAALSPVHRDDATEFALAVPGAPLIGDDHPLLAIGPEQIGKQIGPGKLAAIETGGNGFAMTLDKGGDPARYADAAARICAGRTQCRLLAWTNPRETPKAFPIADSNLSSMSFSYMRVKETGFERLLFNCEEFPSVPRVQCMTRRIPVPATPKLLADERIDKTGIRLPEASKPAADLLRGQLQPTPNRIEVIKLKPRAEAPGGL
jgi:spore germination cell wall hydrolase CwlJ-like protein